MNSVTNETFPSIVDRWVPRIREIVERILPEGVSLTLCGPLPGQLVIAARLEKSFHIGIHYSEFKMNDDNQMEELIRIRCMAGLLKLREGLTE